MQIGQGCKNLELYNCIGTADAPFLVPDGAVGKVYRNNVEVGTGGAGVTVEQDLSSNSQTSVPSVAAVKSVANAKAPLVSPTFTGAPTAPTPLAGTASNAVATTQFVQQALGSRRVVVNGPTQRYLQISNEVFNFCRVTSDKPATIEILNDSGTQGGVIPIGSFFFVRQGTATGTWTIKANTDANANAPATLVYHNCSATTSAIYDTLRVEKIAANTWLVSPVEGTGAASPAPAAGGIDYANSVAHSADTTLTASDLNKLHVLSGPNFTLTLPNPAAGGRLRIQVDEEAAGLYTVIGSSAAKIAGRPARAYWAGESAELVGDGTNWTILSGVRRAMSATLSLGGTGNVSRPAGDYYLLPYATVVSRNCPDAFLRAGGGYNILREGKYLPLAEALYYFPQPNGDCELLILQNDALNAKTVNKFGYTGAQFNDVYAAQPTATKPMELNASDFLVVRHYIETAGTLQNPSSAGYVQLIGTFSISEQLD